MYYDHYKKPTKLGEKMNFSVVREILKNVHISGGSRVLDIGFGKGYYFKELSEKVNKLDYCTIDPNFNKAIHCCDTARVAHIGNTVQDTVLTRYYNLIIASHILEHLHGSTEVLDTVMKLKKALKLNGILIIVIPDYLDLGNDFFAADYSHNYPSTKRRFEQILIDCGMGYSSRYHRGVFFGKLLSVGWILNKIMTISRILWWMTGKEIFFKMSLTFKRNCVFYAWCNT